MLQTYRGVLSDMQHILCAASMSVTSIDAVLEQFGCYEGPGVRQCHLPGNTPKLKVAGRPATNVSGVKEGLPGSGADVAGQVQQH